MAKKRWVGRVFLGRDGGGRQLYHWVDRFELRRERDDAVARERVRIMEEGCACDACVASGVVPAPATSPTGMPTCDAYVDRYLAEYERHHKGSSYNTARQRLARFKKDFAVRPLDSIDRQEAKDWAAGVPASCVPMVVTLFNHAIDEDDYDIPRNPFRGLGRRTKGRAEEPPPTEEEFQALLDACGVLGEYAPTMRALLRFAAFTLMRPGEIFELAWEAIDFDALRIRKDWRVYKGRVDRPKTGAKVIALTPPARDAIMGLPRTARTVFVGKRGQRLSQEAVHRYWQLVLARAGLDFDFYHATKHYGVHYMWTKLGMSRRAIAAQAGWSVSTVDKMLAIYGHGDVGALEEVDAAFEGAEVVPLKVVEGGAGA